MKAAGEWVEAVFLVKALALGLGVSKAWGDSQSYDFVVSRRNLPPARVQVKSSFAKVNDCYLASARINGVPYDQAAVDFIVAYVPPEDAWYVVPVADIHAPGLNLHPHLGRGKYEKYRDAWHLLTGDPEDDNRTLGFTIYAAAQQRHR